MNIRQFIECGYSPCNQIGQLFEKRVIDDHCRTRLINANVATQTSILLNHLIEQGNITKFDTFLMICYEVKPDLVVRIQQEILLEEERFGL